MLPFSKPNTNLSGHTLGILVWICLKMKKGREPEKRYRLFVNSLALKPDKPPYKRCQPNHPVALADGFTALNFDSLVCKMGQQ